MFFIGPVLGGFIGLLVGGLIGLPFLGMIIGAFIGSSSRGAYNFHKRGTFFGNDFGGQNRASDAFFESVFSMLGKIASADGVVSASEERVVRDFMVQQLGLNPQSQQVAMDYFNKACRDSTRDFSYWARNLYNYYHNRPAIMELAYALVQQVAAADGKVSSQEKAMLDAAADIFHLGRSGGDSYRQSGYSSSGNGGSSRPAAVNDLAGAYASLGLTPQASDDEIKKTYRKKVAEFHPDKIAAKGLPAEFTQFATEKFQEIQDSYDKIRKARSF